jgi:protoheme IX farnesyltransferase
MLPWSARLRDVVELTKPAISLLIVAVAVAGFLVAAPLTLANAGRLGLLVAFGGAASAGAAMLNHYFDRDVDARMRRTRNRPLPAARVGRSSAVLAGGIALSAFGIGGATAALNALAGFSILLGSLTYVVVYTLWLKRRTSWNIVIGGFAGSAPALAGSAAAVGSWTPLALGLALLVFLWTPPHFWSLALLLREDYRRAGLPMLPKMADAGYSGKVVVVSAALLLPATLLLAAVGPLAVPVLVGLVALGLVFVGLTAPLWHDARPATARRGFVFSGLYLLAVLLVLMANGPLLQIAPALRL